MEEIIADAVSQTTGTKEVEKQYNKLIEKFGTEFNVLLDASKESLSENSLPEIAEGIIRVREGKVNRVPGYDGVYGKIKVFGKEEQKEITKQKTK